MSRDCARSARAGAARALMRGGRPSAELRCTALPLCAANDPPLCWTAPPPHPTPPHPTPPHPTTHTHLPGHPPTLQVRRPHRRPLRVHTPLPHKRQRPPTCSASASRRASSAFWSAYPARTCCSRVDTWASSSASRRAPAARSASSSDASSDACGLGARGGRSDSRSKGSGEPGQGWRGAAQAPQLGGRTCALAMAHVCSACVRCTRSSPRAARSSAAASWAPCSCSPRALRSAAASSRRDAA